MGRFTAADVLRGNGAVPVTLNRYGYCLGNPLSYVDLNGMKGYYFYDPKVFVGTKVDTECIVASDVAALEEKFKTEIEVVEMDSEGDSGYTTFQDAWEKMDDSEEIIDVVMIMTHANKNYFVSDSTIDKEGERKTSQTVDRKDIKKLEIKNINVMILDGCNMGLTKLGFQKTSLASTFYVEKNRQEIGVIIASDGSIMNGIDKEGKRRLYPVPSPYYHKDGKYDGFKKYYIEDGVLKIEEVLDMSVFLGPNLSQKKYEDTYKCE